MSATATNAHSYCRIIHRQASLYLYYSTQATLWNFSHDPRLSCTEFRRRAYATISSEHVDVEQPRPPPLKNPFPYPPHAKPTAHQIFHLRAGATQAEIKARYYELVKSHHPDSQYAAHLESDVAHSRFRAIQASYDFLRGRTISPHLNARPAPTGKGFDPYMHEMARRRRAYYAYRTVPDEDDGSQDGKSGWGGGFSQNERTIWHEDGWRERLIFGFGIVALVAGLFPSVPITIASTFMPMSTPTSPLVPPLPSSYSPSPSSSAESSASESTDTAQPPNSFSYAFFDLDRGHRKAASALSQARADREEYGPERRDNMKKRVKDMASADQDSQEETVSSEKADVVAPMVSNTREAEGQRTSPESK